MPIVRSYIRQASPAAAPNARKSLVPTAQVGTPQISATPSAESFGAGLGETVARVGQGLLNQQLQQREEQKLQQEQVVLDNELRLYQDLELEILHNTETGALRKVGQQAIGIADQVDVVIEKHSGERRGLLTSDRLRAAYDRMTVQQRARILEPATRHEGAQMHALALSGAEATIANSANLAKLNAGDPVRALDEIATVREKSNHLADLQGLDPESRQLLVGTNVSAAHRGVIEQLAAVNPQNASGYYAHAQKEMTADDMASVRKTLEANTLKADSQREAARIITMIKPETKLSELEEEVDKISDADIQDSVRQRVQQRFSVLKAERAEAEREAGAEAKAILDGIAQDAFNFVRKNPGQTATDLIPAEVLDLLPRETQTALFALSKSQMPGEKKIETDPGTYNRLRLSAAKEPDKFIGENLMNYVHKLAESDWKQLVDLQGNLIKGNREATIKTLDGIRTTDQILRSTFRKNVGDPGDKANQGRFDQFWAAVDEKVRVFQGNEKKAAMETDIQRFADELSMQLVTEDGYFKDAKKPAYEITAANIPSATRKQLEDLLRAAGLPINDENLRAQYVFELKRQQKK